ncbi:MAG: DUF58 domain-containing protein, partial [Isosphaeraceae bacterium]|nr:DUF58 domain-containing protein [Isosphaeraceae bacterium]
MASQGVFGRLARLAARGLRPNQQLRWTREGIGYFIVWVAVLFTGLYQQSNLVLLTAGLAAGPIAASILVSAAMLRGLVVTRRSPAYVFSGDPLVLDYTLEVPRRRTAALALTVLSLINKSEPT